MVKLLLISVLSCASDWDFKNKKNKIYVTMHDMKNLLYSVAVIEAA